MTRKPTRQEGGHKSKGTQRRTPVLYQEYRAVPSKKQMYWSFESCLTHMTVVVNSCGIRLSTPDKLGGQSYHARYIQR